MTAFAAQPQTLHASLIDALSGADPERALEQAFIQLSRGGDVPLLLAMVKALVRCGLAGLAARLLHSSTGLLAAQPQLGALAAQLEAMPSGEMPRAIVERRLKSNIDRLAQRRPELKSTLGSAAEDAVNSARFYTSAKGNHFVIRAHESGRLDFVFPFADQVHHAATANMKEPAIGDAFLMIGVPSVALLMRALNLRGLCGYQPPIDLIETDANVFAMWLALVQDVQAFDGDRVALCIGPGALDEYQSFQRQSPARGLPTITITSVRPHWQQPMIGANTLDEIGKARAERNRQLVRELNQWYEGKDAKYWKGRFAAAAQGGSPLRVVGLTSRFSTVMQHAMRDLAFAFGRRNCVFEVIKQAADHIGSVDVAGELHRLRPEMVVVINHLRGELVDAIPASVPYVCWIQDFMQSVSTKQAAASVGNLDLVLAHSPAVLASVYGYPRERLIATHNLTSRDTFSAEPVPETDRAKFSCDVAYVGHGWESPEQLVAEIQIQNAAFGRYMAEVVAIARQRLEESGCITTQDLVSIILAAERMSGHPRLTPDVRRSMIVPSAQRLIDRVLRHQTLEWTADWATRRGKKFRLFGSGWPQHPQLRQFAAGVIEHGYDLRCAYQAATVHLQVNAYGSLHQRLLDGIASGGFVLTRLNPADFIREPYLRIQQFIQTNQVRDLSTLLRHAERDESLQSALTLAERLTGTRLASSADPVRAAHVAEHLECASLSQGEFSDDDGLFHLLRDLVSIPHRTAADLPGFAQTTFRTRQQLHEMLDRFTADRDARIELAANMRASVLEHDTYDGLVSLILDRWQSA